MKVLKSPFFILGASFFVPTVVLAAGLLPNCGGAAGLNGVDYLRATTCNLCDFGQLIQNVINFLIMISIPISVAMFAWAGILYFTSAGDTHKVDQAHKIFKSVFIGFVIAISGWLVVQVLLSALVRKDFYPGGHWNNLQCVSDNNQRPRNTSLSDVLNPNPADTGILSASLAPSNPSGGTSVVPQCNDGSCTNEQAMQALSTYNAQNSGNQVISAPGVSYTGVDSSLIQTVMQSTLGANAGSVTVTSGNDSTHTTNSEHGTGTAVDVGADNASFNGYIAQNFAVQQQNFVDPSNRAYMDKNGYIWSYESAAATGSTGNHWHVSKDGH